ncbi:MAG TPA: serine/threonine-protein kinase, partial [Polyangiaceae bacterium]
MDAATGTSLGRGRFQVVGRLGEGGAGVVYEVRDRQSDSRLALKTVRGARPEALASLKREFRAVQDITHPNLVRLDELFEEDGDWFFTMELVDGTDWLTYVRGGAGTSPDVDRIRATLGQVVEALAALHTKGTVHRDVKPSNVLVSKAAHVKVLDFGIASGKHRMDDQSEGIVGTLAYMAPEQLLSEEATPAGDFYALGAMLYQALTGQLPYFDHEGHHAEAKLNGPATPVRKVVPNAPEDLATLCDELLKVEPRERPGVEAILRVLGGATVSLGDFAASREEFVGRARELDALWEAFHSAGDGAPVAVVLEGASGVGKSALVNHFLEQVRGRALVLRGRCHEREYVPYKGIDAIVDDLAAYLGGGADEVLFSLSNSAIRLLPRLFPVLKRVPFFDRLPHGSIALAEGDASELRARIFGAFRELMRRVAEQGPVVVTIDDVQWADGDSLALLSDLLAPPDPPPLLLVCTRRVAEEEGATKPFTLPGDLRTFRLGG